jgi:hypothetical protein
MRGSPTGMLLGRMGLRMQGWQASVMTATRVRPSTSLRVRVRVCARARVVGRVKVSTRRPVLWVSGIVHAGDTKLTPRHDTQQ